jgi:hypothetical protein
LGQDYGKLITHIFPSTPPFMAVLSNMAVCLDGLLFLATLNITLTFKISLLYFHQKLPFSGSLFASEVELNQAGAGRLTT